ncbi:(2Fe-2S)-binding protein [Desulfotalea psychrophila]|uniref:Probable aldehyde oxidoreductase n=1 Tax=Desulfotalea psychrophila (strain LSv54 / DSM 12343) TaxID=177439 RepID=Q6AMH0_DESPS|nr:(2Fe-2S)-binding protein [Desulfotalea psychrophila]CAG36455.1 probable aldehyde oxidoreductase [Desulfotalea psychrophila LSv54]
MSEERSSGKYITLTINGEKRPAWVESHHTLAEVLRNTFGLTGTKEACEEGACGACTILIDGVAQLACMLLATEQTGKEIETIEGLAANGELHPIQEAWLQEYAAQCGYCSAGMIMSTKSLLNKNPNPSQSEIREALGGNICVCSNYEHIFAAVDKAAKIMRGEEQNE